MSSNGLTLSKKEVSMSSEGLDLAQRREGWCWGLAKRRETVCGGEGRREKREEAERERELRAEESEGAAMETGKAYPDPQQHSATKYVCEEIKMNKFQKIKI